MKLAVVFGMIIAGFLLVVVSTLWSSLFPATSTWTDDKATRAIEVKARLSNLGPIVNGPPRMQRGPDPATLKQEFDALQKENEQLNAEFEAAANRPKSASTVLRWSGILLAVVGLIGWYAVKNSE